MLLRLFSTFRGIRASLRRRALSDKAKAERVPLCFHPTITCKCHCLVCPHVLQLTSFWRGKVRSEELMGLFGHLRSRKARKLLWPTFYTTRCCHGTFCCSQPAKLASQTVLQGLVHVRLWRCTHVRTCIVYQPSNELRIGLRSLMVSRSLMR